MIGRAAVLAVVLCPLPLAVGSGPARADFHIRFPTEIDYGEFEIETNGAAAFDHDPSLGGEQSYTIEFGTGVTPWWKTEIELGFNRDPGNNQPTLLTAAVTENTIQLTEPGEYFVDSGIYFEYAQSLTRGAHAAANEFTIGPLFSKDIGRTTHTANLFLTKQLGPDQTSHGLDFSYAWQSRWNLWAPLSPAVEFYGDTGSLGTIPGFSRQPFLIGPVAVGELSFTDFGISSAGRVKYELGWLFGATPATATGTLKWRLEVEIPF